MDFLDKRDPSKPFALYAHKKLEKRGNVRLGNDVMHHTFEPVPMDEAEFIKPQKDYYSAITGLNGQFARIYAYLKEHNLFDDTIVVLTIDHGEMLTSHGLTGIHVWYEESIGIPLAISGRGLEPRTISTALGTPDMARAQVSFQHVQQQRC